MKKTIKKIFGVCFVVAMFLCITALFASAETYRYNGKDYEIQTEGDFKYFVVTDENALSDWDKAHSGTGAFLQKYTGTSASVSIPLTLGGHPVVEIYSNAFEGNTALQTVTIGESVNLIANAAFKNCTGLQTVLIAKNVESIDAESFYGCTALKSVTFQKGTQLVNIGYSAFWDCTSLNNFTIPETVESIGDGAFYNCYSMTSVDIPDSVTFLGAGAYFHCSSVVDLKIGDGVTALATRYERYKYDNDWGSDTKQDGCFEGCISLKTVTFGGAIETIGQDCFAGTSLINLFVPANVKTISICAFMNCVSLETVEIVGCGTTTVGEKVFNECSALTKIVFGDGVASIGNHVLNNCDSLTDIQIGDNVITIGDYAFLDCDGLVSVVIPTNVTTLGAGAFFHCDDLETVVIGNGVTALATRYERYKYDNNWGSDTKQDGCFEGCINLKNITIGSAVKTIGQDCFAGTVLENVYIPDNVITIDNSAFRNCSVLTNVVIGNGVTLVGASVFENCDALVKVTIGDGVVTISDYAFFDCDGFKEIYIPSNVTTLGLMAFAQCDNLQKVIIGNGVTSLTSRYDKYKYDSNWGTDTKYDGMFEGCINLREVTLGSGIISIGQDTFAGTQVTSLTIPGKVSTVSAGAFAGATQLKDIYFTGNWAANAGDRLFENVAEGYTVHYISGKIGYDDLEYNKAAFSPVTVTFDINNDDVFAAPTDSQILAPVGGYVIEPINPTAFGYIFVGWYKDADCRQPWNFETDKVTSDVTLYAKWNAVDEVVPVRPENISTVEKDGNSITLKWSAVDGATGYNVYVDGIKVNDSLILTTEYKVTGLESSTTYEFVVRAVNSKGESADSLIFAERTTDHIHAYGEWTIVKNETCNDDGEKTRKCECGNVEKEVIPSTGAHGFGEWYVSLEPTCVDKGEQTRVCSTCGTKETKELPLTIEHSFGNWIVVKEATKTEEGLKERTCKHCEKTETLVIPTLSSVLKGDANGDGKITAADARIVLRISAQLEKVDKYTQPFEVFDVNGDGKITASDARKVLRISAKLES